MKVLFSFLMMMGGALPVHAQNVGIGTASPLEKLHISNGQLRLSRTASFDNNIIFNMPAASGALSESQGLQFRLGDVSKGYIGYSSSLISGNILRLSNSAPGSSDLVIAESGNVGVGTSFPAEKLHIAGNALMNATNPILQLQNAGVDKGYVQLSGDNLRMGTNGGNTTGNMIVRLNGDDLFSFHNYLNAGSAQIYLHSNGVQTGLLHATTNGDISLTNVSANKQVRLGNEIYIDGTGNKTGIGTAIPSERLHVNGNVKLDGQLLGSATGTFNMMPLCYARINSSGTVYSGTPNLSSAKEGSIYKISCPGITVSSVYQVTVHADGSGLLLASAKYAAPGEAIVSFSELKAIIDDPGGFFAAAPAPFFIVIYNP